MLFLMCLLFFLINPQIENRFLSSFSEVCSILLLKSGYLLIEVVMKYKEESETFYILEDNDKEKLMKYLAS